MMVIFMACLLRFSRAFNRRRKAIRIIHVCVPIEDPGCVSAFQYGTVADSSCADSRQDESKEDGLEWQVREISEIIYHICSVNVFSCYCCEYVWLDT